MLIEIAILFAFCCVVGALIVKAYEWGQGVLYGPYIVRQNRSKTTRRSTER
jgi:hypothetical protein